MNKSKKNQNASGVQDLTTKSKKPVEKEIVRMNFTVLSESDKLFVVKASIPKVLCMKDSSFVNFCTVIRSEMKGVFSVIERISRQ